MVRALIQASVTRRLELRPHVKPTFFAGAAQFREWLEANHGSATELLVGFYKRSSAKPSITWPEAVDEALCFGWIDGIRRRIDDVSYTIRFTPRKARSTWSAVNVARVKELTRLRQMRPAGLRAYQQIDRQRSRIYSYEQRDAAKLDPGGERQFRASPNAWEFFRSQAPWYQRTAIWWVMSGKREATRQKRLATLILDSERGRKLRQLDRQAAVET
jgi:uncharacterized protein YdeI (YjbR/CyaY-like superfamily)